MALLRRPAATIDHMLAAYVWHWWIGVILFVATLAGVVALIVGYIKQVEAPKYPPRDQLRK